MPDHAELAVAAARNVDAIELDYSVTSLEAVDRILARFHDQRLTPDQIGETVFAVGAYVGEVIVRTAKGRWVDPLEPHPLGGGWPMIELPSGTVVNPVGKAFRRVENEGDSIRYFYEVLVR